MIPMDDEAYLEVLRDWSKSTSPLHDEEAKLLIP